MGSLMNKDELRAIAARVGAISGDHWALAQDDDGTPVVEVRTKNGGVDTLRLKRELTPASLGDVRFVASAREDVHYLLALLERGGLQGDDDRLDDIEDRVVGASAGPWMVSLEANGGLGGSNVITVSYEDAEPDLYLWLGDALAPDSDWVFVGNVRQDIPRLLAAARKRAA